MRLGLILAAILSAAVACERARAQKITTIATDSSSWERTYSAAGSHDLAIVDVREASAALRRVCNRVAQVAIISQKPTEEALRCPDRKLSAHRVGELSLVVAAHPKNDWVGAFDWNWIPKIATIARNRTPLWSDLDESWPGEPLNLYCPRPGDELWQVFVDSVGGKGMASRLGCRPLACGNCSNWLGKERGALVWSSSRVIDELGFAPFQLPDGHVRWRRGIFLAFGESERGAIRTTFAGVAK